MRKWGEGVLLEVLVFKTRFCLVNILLGFDTGKSTACHDVFSYRVGEMIVLELLKNEVELRGRIRSPLS